MGRPFGGGGGRWNSFLSQVPIARVRRAQARIRRRSPRFTLLKRYEGGALPLRDTVRQHVLPRVGLILSCSFFIQTILLGRVPMYHRNNSKRLLLTDLTRKRTTETTSGKIFHEQRVHLCSTSSSFISELSFHPVVLTNMQG